MNRTKNQLMDTLSFLDADIVPSSAESVDSHIRTYEHFLQTAARYRTSEAFRRSLEGDSGRNVLATFGLETPLPEDMEANVLVNTDELMHFIMPSDPNISLTDEQLSSVAGGWGSTASSLSTAGSFSTVACSTAPSSASSIACGGTAGSASSS